MKKPIRKKVLSLLAVLVSSGFVHAEGGPIQIPTSQTKQAILEELVQSGVLVPFGTPDWYQINQVRLDEILNDERSEDFAQDTLSKLKLVLGDKVNVREVGIFEANVGTQDVMQ